MRTLYIYIIGVCFGIMLLTACNDVGEEPVSDGHVKAALAFSVSDKPIGLATTTRMAAAVVPDDGVFLGMTVMNIIPFTTTSAVTIDDEPVDLVLSDRTDGSLTGNKHYFLYSNCSFTPGTARMLVYGMAELKALPEGFSNSKMYNGVLNYNFPANLSPAGITFQLEQISPNEPVETDESDKAWKIAKYMTSIAQTTGWNDPSNAVMYGYYKDFIGMVESEPVSYSLLAGSSVSVKAYVNALKSKLDLQTGELKENIIANIGEESSFDTNYGGYPENLPDGAAMLKWDATNSKFVVQTKTAPNSPINSLTSFVYPPNLWYYANSPIKTSDAKVNEENVYISTNAWSDVLGNYASGSVVSHNTLAVAIENAVQYAVARLDIQLTALPATLKDQANDDVTGIDNSKFPITGVIIGGQRTLGFDFKPKEPLSDEDLRYIYDGYPAVTTDNYNTRTVKTLVLQTYDNETVRFVLEFRNNSDKDFKGINGGIIYRGTKFYLACSVDPTTLTNNKRIFTQDHKTVVKLKVESLAKAYNVMPDLQSPRLELGVVVTSVWTTKDDTHEVYNW